MVKVYVPYAYTTINVFLLMVCVDLPYENKKAVGPLVENFILRYQACLLAIILRDPGYFTN